MTREEAIKILKELPNNILGVILPFDIDFDYTQALDMAVKALEQEPTQMIDKSNFSQEQYKTDLQSAYDCGKSVLDKIRAEIMAIGNWSTKSELPNGYLVKVLEIIDKYKAESEKDVCKDCYHNDGRVHAECVVCSKAESEDKK